MKITNIAKMGSEDKFAIFVDDTLKIILSGQSILDLGINIGKTVTEEEIKSADSYSANEKLYNMTLKYINLRLRSENELRQYLKRKNASPDQIKQIVERLTKLGLINDEYYVKAFIHDKLLMRPASKRKIIYELRKKKVSEEIIQASLDNDQINDQENLKRTIEIKRNQSKYKDDLKLMQYLVRNGYNYSDVKQAIAESK
jgi:regulatory protein